MWLIQFQICCDGLKMQLVYNSILQVYDRDSLEPMLDLWWYKYILVTVGHAMFSNSTVSGGRTIFTYLKLT